MFLSPHYDPMFEIPGNLFYQSIQSQNSALFSILSTNIHPVNEPNSSLSKSNSHVKLLHLTNAAKITEKVHIPYAIEI